MRVLPVAIIASFLLTAVATAGEPDTRPNPPRDTGRVVLGTIGFDDDGEFQSDIPTVINADLIQSLEAPPSTWIQQTKQDVRALETQTPQLAAGAAMSARSRRAAIAFGSAVAAKSLLSRGRRKRGAKLSASVVLGAEAGLRATSDAGDLLGKSASTVGISTEKRTPVITDPRIRGSSVGQLLASGSHWVPARQDLDTILSKIDSRIVDEMIVIKGPYAARYGPGFNFVDVQLLRSPRYENGYETHGRSLLEYKTNGEQWYGRQTVDGGDEDWGFRIGYGHRTGSDYESGDGTEIPASYKSRDLDVAIGFDLEDGSTIEFSYLRLDQTDVEVAGQIFDFDFLKTDGFEVIWTKPDVGRYDELTLEGWYNNTEFQGNAQRAGKRRQVPLLDTDGFTGFTDVESASTGFSFELADGGPGEFQHALGVDFRFVRQELTEVNSSVMGLTVRPINTDINFPIPQSRSSNPGLFLEFEMPASERLTIRGGTRVDWVNTNAQHEEHRTVASMRMPPVTLEQDSGAKFDQYFNLVSGFLTVEYRPDEHWTTTMGAGYAMRPPTLTELYAQGPFLAVLPQFVFTSPVGNPNLAAEERTQIDIGATADYGTVRLSAQAFHAWIADYITLDYFFPANDSFVYFWTNTPLATLAGFEASGEVVLNDYMTCFGTINYTEGRDHTREKNAVIFPPRSTTFGGFTLATSDREPLPAISPLEARAGLRIQNPDQTWGVELAARIVDNQDRVAISLGETRTPGFTTYDIRGFARPSENLILVAGVENLSDKQYQEHFDSRLPASGVYQTNPVFRPGINFYFSTELTY